MLIIIQAPHPVLSEKARKIKKIDKKIKTLIKEMSETLEQTTDPEGVGLAAPQVGESLQLFIIKESAKAPLRTFINPQILSLSSHQYLNINNDSSINNNQKKKNGIKLEGCLSLKDIWGIVHRSSSVKLSYTDESGNSQIKTFKGFLSTIIQHECDHLQGTLFPKRVLEQKEKLYKSIKDENDEAIFEELAI